MNPIVQSLLALLVKLAPLIGGANPIVGLIINTLIQIVPVIIQEAQDLLPMVKNIIATLKGDSSVTADQLAQLDALDKQVDDAFEAAAAAALAQDNPPAPT